MKKILGHLKTILIHKYYVFINCCKLGIPLRGLMHDLSKFSPVEFFESAKYYDGKSSPINRAIKDKGYSLAWTNHTAKNKHHFEYWLGHVNDNFKPVPMPYKITLEYIADIIAASKTYNGKNFNTQMPYAYFVDFFEGKEQYIHSHTYNFMRQVFLYYSLTEFFPKKRTLKNYWNFTDTK